MDSGQAEEEVIDLCSSDDEPAPLPPEPAPPPPGRQQRQRRQRRQRRQAAPGQAAPEQPHGPSQQPPVATAAAAGTTAAKGEAAEAAGAWAAGGPAADEAGSSSGATTQGCQLPAEQNSSQSGQDAAPTAAPSRSKRKARVPGRVEADRAIQFVPELPEAAAAAAGGVAAAAAAAAGAASKEQPAADESGRAAAAEAAGKAPPAGHAAPAAGAEGSSSGGGSGDGGATKGPKLQQLLVRICKPGGADAQSAGTTCQVASGGPSGSGSGTGNTGLGKPAAAVVAAAAIGAAAVEAVEAAAGQPASADARHTAGAAEAQPLPAAAPPPQQQQRAVQQLHHCTGDNQGSAAGRTADMAFRKTGPKFLASTRAVLYKLTPSNVGQGEHAGEASRIRITHPVYWQMLDSMPHIAGQLQPGAQDEPRFIRLTHGRDTWEVPLKWIKKDGYQLEPDICALVLQGIGAYQANTFIVLELDTEQCSRQRLVGTIRRVDGSFPVASLPGRLLNPAAAAGRGEGLEFEHPVCAERLSASMPGGQLEEEDPSEQISWLGCMQPRSKRQKTHSRMAWEGVRSVLASLLHLPNVERVFGGPVDTVLYSDYLQVVQQPMDLGTIQKRLSDGAYDSPLQFCDDVRLVWSNCLRYNPPGNPVRDLGDTAAQQFDELWEQEGVERHWEQHLAQQQGAAAPVAARPAEPAAGGASTREGGQTHCTAGEVGEGAAEGVAPAGEGAAESGAPASGGAAEGAAPASESAAEGAAPEGEAAAAVPAGEGAAEGAAPAGKAAAAALPAQLPHAAEAVVADSGCLLGQLRKESKQEHQGQWMVKDVGAAGEQAQQTQQAQQAQPQEAACAQGQKRQRYEEAEEDEEQQQQQRWRQQPLQQQQQGGKRAKPGAAATTQQHVGLAPLLHGGSTNVVGAPLWLSQPGVLHSAALRPQPWPMGHLPPGYVPFNPTPDMLRAAAEAFKANPALRAAFTQQPPQLVPQPAPAGWPAGQPAGDKPLPPAPTPDPASSLPAAPAVSPPQHSPAVPLVQPAGGPGAAAAATVAAAADAAAASGGSVAAGPAMAADVAGRVAALAEGIMQRRLANALVALGEADDEPLSWRRALHKLLKSGKGGATVEGILEQWERLPHKAQQAVYEEAVMAVQQEDWGQLEARLQQELDAAIEDAQTAGSG